MQPPSRRILRLSTRPGLDLSAFCRCLDHPRATSHGAAVILLAGIAAQAPMVQWYPGHIARAERQLKEQLRMVDVVMEVRDARIPVATHHPQVCPAAQHCQRDSHLSLVSSASAGLAWRLARDACVTGSQTQQCDAALKPTAELCRSPRGWDPSPGCWS